MLSSVKNERALDMFVSLRTDLFIEVQNNCDTQFQLCQMFVK